MNIHVEYIYNCVKIGSLKKGDADCGVNMLLADSSILS
jgi:hypothetical protein